MRRSLFAIFRGRDGRSLAWALALLLVVNAFVAGAHTGFAASPSAVLCTIDKAAGDSQAPAGHGEPCCLAGCLTPALGLGDAVAALPLPVALPGRALSSPDAAIVMVLPPIGSHGPRGPPLFA
jgi:hypothetical protein